MDLEVARSRRAGGTIKSITYDNIRWIIKHCWIGVGSRRSFSVYVVCKVGLHFPLRSCTTLSALSLLPRSYRSVVVMLACCAASRSVKGSAPIARGSVIPPERLSSSLRSGAVRAILWSVSMSCPCLLLVMRAEAADDDGAIPLDVFNAFNPGSQFRGEREGQGIRLASGGIADHPGEGWEVRGRHAPCQAFLLAFVIPAFFFTGLDCCHTHQPREACWSIGIKSRRQKHPVHEHLL